MTDGDIHNRTQKINNTIQRIEKTDVKPENRETVLEFRDFLFSQDLSKDRISRHLYNWLRMLPHLEFTIEEAEKKDIVRLIGKINQSTINDKDEAAQATKAEYRKSVRKMYKDFLGNQREHINGKELTDFFNIGSKSPKVDPEELPEPQHVKALVKNADRIRDKALIMTLWSSGGRIGEILGLKWKDIQFKDRIASVRFRETKTGGSRTVPLTAGYLYLKEHQEKDHKSDDPEAFVFRSINSDQQLSHKGACNMIQRNTPESIPDRIRLNPHAFRKGRATYLASEGMNQSTICEYFGWVQGSEKAACYVRMADKDVERGIKKVAGYEIEEQESERDLHPVKCPNCGNLNKFEAVGCKECDETLQASDLFSQVKVDEATKKLRKTIIEEKTGTNNEEINQHAREIVAQDLGIEPAQLQ